MILGGRPSISIDVNDIVGAAVTCHNVIIMMWGGVSRAGGKGGGRKREGQYVLGSVDMSQ